MGIRQIEDVEPSVAKMEAAERSFVCIVIICLYFVFPLCRDVTVLRIG